MEPATGTSLINQNLATFSAGNNSLPQLSTGGWYQIVIVGNGPGTPLQYYLTPMTATAGPAVSDVGDDDSDRHAHGDRFDAEPANRQRQRRRHAADTPTLNFKDLAIFNQALTPDRGAAVVRGRGQSRRW